MARNHQYVNDCNNDDYTIPGYRNLLHKYCAERRWSEAHQRAVECPADACVFRASNDDDDDYDDDNVLVTACRNDAPLRVVRSLIEACPSQIRGPPVGVRGPPFYGTALHEAIVCGCAPDVVERLLDADADVGRGARCSFAPCATAHRGRPSATASVDARSRTPSHHASEIALMTYSSTSTSLRVLERVVRASPNVGVIDADGATPLTVVLRGRSRWTGRTGLQVRERRSSFERGDNDDDDESASPDRRAERRLLGVLLRVRPEAASATDADGRLPLHVAIESEKRWRNLWRRADDDDDDDDDDDSVPMLVLRAYPAAIERRDVWTRLFPFMLAAVGENAVLSTVYELLRKCPTLVLIND